ncbi:hypothetical protein [Kitasatospora viridis]|uniref:hypothetical protein n=1 Tax=Kitasatospora viridis TaxID=281105 RepID=UPI0011A1AB95|nr:hypothetical protein [Kitasatospora viridis]
MDDHCGGGTGEFRAGDVLLLECPFTATTVTKVGPHYLSVRWPWLVVDPAVDSIRWNGDFAIALPGSLDWGRLHYGCEPPVQELRAGDACRVGLAPTVVHVLRVDHFDPPLETGMLPRPACYVTLLAQGEAEQPEDEDQGFPIDPAGGEPLRLDLLLRPYAFLEPGDELADRAGRAWRFDAAWEWHAFDGAEPGGDDGQPAWPLVLLTRGGAPVLPQSEPAEAVARATASGSHAEQLARWTELTRVAPLRYPG